MPNSHAFSEPSSYLTPVHGWPAGFFWTWWERGLGLSVAVIWWSAAGILTSLANSAAIFGTLRFLLGIGEGVNWPGASKAVAPILATVCIVFLIRADRAAPEFHDA